MMNTMRRWVFNVAAGMSMLLCMATLADWCTHRWRINWIGLRAWRSEGGFRVIREVSVITGSGVVCPKFSVVREPPTLPSTPTVLDYGSIGPPQLNWKLGDSFLNRLGFGILNSTRTNTPRATTVTTLGLELPSWLATLFFLVVPVIWVRRWSRQCNAHNSGVCVVCGYDLRATPDRCPECGTISTKVTETAK